MATLVLTPNSGTPGDVITLSGTGYTVGDTMTFKYGGAGGVAITTTPAVIVVDGTGAIPAAPATTFVIPETGKGSSPVDIYATDQHATTQDANLTITSSLVFTPTHATVATTLVQVEGHGFTDAKTPISSVKFNGSAVVVAPAAPAIASGYWTATFTVPHAPYGAETVEAKSTGGGADDVTGTFNVDSELILTLAAGPVGTVVTVTGTGYDASMPLTAFTFNALTPAGQTVVGKTTTPTGDFPSSGTATFAVPDTSAAANPVTVTAATAGVTASFTGGFTVNPSFIMTPSHAKVATAAIAVAGHGYTNGDTMLVFTFSGVQPAVQTVAGVAVVQANGTFTGTFTVPAGVNGTHPVIATDNHAVTKTVNFTIDAGMLFNPTSGSEADVVTVTGSGFSNGKTIATFTFAGIAVALTPAAPVIGATGAWTGTFPVPNETTGPKAVVAVSTQPETGTGSFTISGGSMAPDGKASGSDMANSTVGAAITTTHDQDFVIGVFAWEDTVGTDTVGTISDVAGLTWKLRGKTSVVYDGTSKYFYMQKFYAYAPVNLVADVITLTIVDSTGVLRAVTALAFHVWASSYLNSNVFDLNPGMPYDFIDTGVHTAESPMISTFIAPAMIYAAILTSQTSAIVAGAGYTEIENTTIGDFTLETEYLIVTDLKNQFPVTWTLANHNYKVIMMELDAEAEIDSSSNPWKTIDRSGLVEPVLGNVEEGVTRAGYPTITVAGQTITYDRSEGATYTKDEDHSAENNPTSAPPANQWG